MNERAPDFLKAHKRRNGVVCHILTLDPATEFEYRFESSAGIPRLIHLERGALEPTTPQSFESCGLPRGSISSGEPDSRWIFHLPRLDQSQGRITHPDRSGSFR